MNDYWKRFVNIFFNESSDMKFKNFQSLYIKRGIICQEFLWNEWKSSEEVCFCKKYCLIDRRNKRSNKAKW